jgi:hypothetical protein
MNPERTKPTALFLLLLLLLAACAAPPAAVPATAAPATAVPAPAVPAPAGTAPASSPTLEPQTPTATADPAYPPRATLLPNLVEPVPFEAADLLPAGLAVNVYRLNQPIVAEEVGFDEIRLSLGQRSQLSRQPEGRTIWSDRPQYLQQDLMTVSFAYDETAAQPNGTARVLRAGEVIFETQLNNTAFRHPLVGFWTYGEHWALETLGSVIIDGQAVNDLHGYSESFEFHLLGGQPLYFFSRAGRLGMNYAGQEIPLPGDEISHYLCCSGSLLNPVQVGSGLVLLANSGEQSYYLEIEVQE